MDFDLAFALSAVPIILGVAGATLGIALATCLGAALLGFGLELLRRSHPVFGLLARFMIDFIRSTPVLAWIYFLYFVLPFYGVILPAIVVGAASLSLYYSGYLAEVFKAGIDAIPKGQSEAARALNLGRADTLTRIIAPQMLRNIAAPMGNYFVSILKATPYLAVIAVPEMLGRAFDIASDTYRYAEPLTVAGILFLILASTISYGVRLLERRMLTP